MGREINSMSNPDGVMRQCRLPNDDLTAACLALPGIGDDPAAPPFRPQRSARNNGKDGFRPKPMTTKAVEKLIGRYVTALALDANVTGRSLRVTALTTARERGSDIIDVQDFAGHGFL
jgi:hypothetical protein